MSLPVTLNAKKKLDAKMVFPWCRVPVKYRSLVTHLYCSLLRGNKIGNIVPNYV